MSQEPIVSDIVLAMVQASCASIRAHFSWAFEANEGELDQLLQDMLLGMASDLSDARLGAEWDGFQHALISSCFRISFDKFNIAQRSKNLLGVDKHIWAQDYDRDLKSLLPTAAIAPPEEKENISQSFRERTRVSAVVQQALIKHRSSIQAAKATKRDEKPKRQIFVPSPFYIASKVLTDPDVPASAAYAQSAIRCEIQRLLEKKSGAIKLTHANISSSLELIKNRSATSKPIKVRADQNPVVLFICHYLAAKGLLSIEASLPNEAHKFLALFDSAPAFVENKIETRSVYGFRMHPDVRRLPDASELLNELDGLPLPIEGADVVFKGGLRFSTGGDIIAALSGPFGAGKTSACLSIAAALAPLGCRTLFVTCEEDASDIRSRLDEAFPEFVLRSTPLFRCVTLDDVRLRRRGWFSAHKLRVVSAEGGGSDLSDLRRLIRHLVSTAPIFEVYDGEEYDEQFPSFARKILVIDGFHQLLRELNLDQGALERALRLLIDDCRELNAIILLTFASDEPELNRLDYLCDVVVELNRSIDNNTGGKTGRTFKLVKTRRQPSLTGTHTFHLSGSKGFRIKPNMHARAEISKRAKWIEPNASEKFYIDKEFGIQNSSQILLYGRGSSGKAGLGLYLLHRRPIEQRLLGTNIDWDFSFSESLGLFPSKTTVERTQPFYQARTLVVSFLYQPSYYISLKNRLKERVDRRHSFLPDDYLVDTLPLYAGDLGPEDFISKIEKKLAWGELKGIPYTGVLIDGIHNVFVQFPILERHSEVWPQIFSFLRQKGVNVVTTHSEFEISEAGKSNRLLDLEFEHAARKVAPLLSALVSASDYVFDLSAVRRGRPEYRFSVKTMLGDEPPAGHAIWDRQQLNLSNWVF